MRIYYVASEMLPVPPVLGGAVETWIYEIALRLKGINVCILSWDHRNCSAPTDPI